MFGQKETILSEDYAQLLNALCIIIINCPICGKKLRVPKKFTPIQVFCPNCNIENGFTVENGIIK